MNCAKCGSKIISTSGICHECLNDTATSPAAAIKNNEPAFPNGEMENNISPQHYGLTKRELFAGDIMAALASDWHQYFLSGAMSNAHELIAERSVKLADALLAELAKEVENEG